ncbi:MAG TPA: S8 family peptidase [Thermoanaerobaculia bacterium]|jgi:subtilisin family serine protease
MAEEPTSKKGKTPKAAKAGEQTTPRPEAQEEEEERRKKLPMSRATIPPGMHDPEQRHRWGLPRSEQRRGFYMVEVNLLFRGGLQEAREEFLKLWERVLGRSQEEPLPVSKTYFRCEMTVEEWRKLIKEDEKASERRDRLIYRIWPDFPVKPLIYQSVPTVKADAALRSYEASGADIVWAVIDSGIDAAHRHFGDPEKPESHVLLHPDVRDLHRDFTLPGPATKENSATALTDDYGHGTHVAGIIAGGLAKDLKSGKDFRVYETVFSSDPDAEGKEVKLEERTVRDSARLRGVAPFCKLVSLKALDERGAGQSSNVMRALQYIREELNGDPKILRVHGVNLSIGYEFDAEMFACGQSPLCVEVDRLVKSGVVVVVAAGNTGYGSLEADQRPTKVGLSNTINDPGNAALAITVGATHRDSPHTYGVSYFSSKGPTGDGRLKPDLVAPGERITSCAAGLKLQKNGGEVPDDVPAYIDDSGTSMAAPHVSGAVAAFLSIRREFIQRPEEVKRIFLESATALGRERYFEGHGLLDLMRAIQSV